MNGYMVHQVRLNSPKKYWNSENDFNRLLSEKYWYFTTNSNYHRKGDYYIYFMGNHGDEISLFGKPISDANYAVVFTASPDPVLEKLRAVQDRLTRYVSGAITVADIGMVTKPAIYKYLLDSEDNVPALYRDRFSTVMEDPFKLSLTTGVTTTRFGI